MAQWRGGNGRNKKLHRCHIIFGSGLGPCPWKLALRALTERWNKWSERILKIPSGLLRADPMEKKKAEVSSIVP